MLRNPPRRVAVLVGLCALALCPVATAKSSSAPPYTVKVYDRSAVASSFVGGDWPSYYQRFLDGSGSGWVYSTPSGGSLSLYSTSFAFVPSWPARNLTLTLRDPSTGAYVSDAAGTAADAYLCQGGAISATASAPGALAGGFMQCYNAARTLGFYVKWPPFSNGQGGGGSPCIKLAPGSVPGSEVIDSGTSCMAHVSVRSGGSFTLLTEPGTDTPECFMISFRVEADPA